MLEKLPIEVIVTIGLWMAGMVFAAGGAWFALKESQRHVNGLGAKVNAMDKARQERDRRLSIAIVSLAVTEQQKLALLSCLAEATDHK